MLYTIVNTFVTEMSIMGPTSQVYTSHRVCTGTLGTPCRFAYGYHLSSTIIPIQIKILINNLKYQY